MIFVVSTPAQEHFVRQLKVALPESLTIRLDTKTAEPLSPLPSDLDQYADTIGIPYYDCWDLMRFALNLRARFPKAGFFYYYESLLSYVMGSDFRQECYDRFGADLFTPSDMSGRFIGVRELDTLFSRRSHPLALPYNALFPKRAERLPLDLLDVEHVFLGQPLVQDGTLTIDQYYGLLKDLLADGSLDAYVAHPRETMLPDFLPVVRLPAPVECYAHHLFDRNIHTVFSSSAAYFLVQGSRMVNIHTLPEHYFRMSAYAHRVYGWLKFCADRNRGEDYHHEDRFSFAALYASAAAPLWRD